MSCICSTNYVSCLLPHGSSALLHCLQCVVKYALVTNVISNTICTTPHKYVCARTHLYIYIWEFYGGHRSMSMVIYGVQLKDRKDVRI